MELVRGGEESNKLGVAAESKQVGTLMKSTCDGRWAMGDEGIALALGPLLEGWWAIYFRCVNGKCDGSGRRRTLEDGGRSSEGRSRCQVGAFNMDRGGQASSSGRAANVDCRLSSVVRRPSNVNLYSVNSLACLHSCGQPGPAVSSQRPSGQRPGVSA